MTPIAGALKDLRSAEQRAQRERRDGPREAAEKQVERQREKLLSLVRETGRDLDEARRHLRIG